MRRSTTAVAATPIPRALAVAVVVTAAVCTLLATAGCERSQPGPKPISGETSSSHSPDGKATTTAPAQSASGAR